MKNSRILQILILGLAGQFLLACEKGDRSYSLLSDVNIFQQEKSSTNKVDIVWLVDGSGTMVNHQSNLAANFDNFINQFVNKGFDYNIVVAGTDAWLREVNYSGGSCGANPNPSGSPNTMYVSSADCQPTVSTYGQLTQFRDGDIYGAINGSPGLRSGKYLISSAMMSPLEVIQTFATNVKTGTRADGHRESAFQSLRSVLRRNSDGTAGYNGETHTVLSQFRRPDAFLAVIVVTDEEDQSRKQNGTTYASNSEFTTDFLTFLDGYTGSSANNRKYNVSGIVLEDINNCQYGLHPQATQGDRYVSIADASRGIIGNICSPDFSTQLQGIADRIATLATRFQLSREPVPSTIQIWVNGQAVPESTTNGWSYYTETNGAESSYFIEFHGDAVPPEGAQIAVDFDPTAPKS